VNEDHHVDDGNAMGRPDGMGGHSQGKWPSRWLSMPSTQSSPRSVSTAALESVSIALARVEYATCERAALGCWTR